MNRLSTAGFVPPSVSIGFRLIVPLGDVQATCPRCFGECEGGLFPRRTVLWANSLARPRPATPPCAPTRHARGMSGFWIRQLCRIQNPDIPRAGRGGRKWWAVPGRAGRGRGGAVRPEDELKLSTPRAPSTTLLDDPSSMNKNEILCKHKPNQGTQRAVDERFISGIVALFVPGCWALGRRLLIVVNPRHVRETIFSNCPGIDQVPRNPWGGYNSWLLQAAFFQSNHGKNGAPKSAVRNR